MESANASSGVMRRQLVISALSTGAYPGASRANKQQALVCLGGPNVRGDVEGLRGKQRLFHEFAQNCPEPLGMPR